MLGADVRVDFCDGAAQVRFVRLQDRGQFVQVLQGLGTARVEVFAGGVYYDCLPCCRALLLYCWTVGVDWLGSA